MDERIQKLREDARLNGNPVLRDKSLELLLKTVKEKRPKTILEIGTNLGLSGIAMLLESEGSRLTGIEIDEERANEAKENYKIFGVMDRARIIIGSASDVLPVLDGEYDFIFLDGPKGHYYEYLNSIDKLLKKGGVLFADNVLYRGFLSGKVKVPHKHATILHSLQNFILEINNKEKYKTEIYEIEDGVSITEKL